MLWATFSLVLGLAADTPPGVSLEAAGALLASSDVSTLAPKSFRARLVVARAEGTPLHLDVWRAGDTRTLVRFLDAKDSGKYLLKRDGQMFFISPRTRLPVRLDPSYKLSGAASLDQVLGTHYSREYDVVGTSQGEAGLVGVELIAKSPAAPFPRARYWINLETKRPVRVEFFLKNGKATGSVVFLEWAEAARPHPRRLRVTDALRPKASVEVEIPEVDEREVPDSLFSLEDRSARTALEAAGSP